MKRPFTLIELIVALALSVGLFTFLFTTIQQTRRADQKAQEIIRPIKREYALYQQLNRVIPEIEEKLYSDKESLVFTYNNGIDKDPHFCSLVLARLYLDKGRLILATWPHPRWKDHTCRVQVLSENVHRFTFKFLDPPNWTKTRSKEEEELPAMIKFEIDKKTFSFPIIAAGKPVRYIQK